MKSAIKLVVPLVGVMLALPFAGSGWAAPALTLVQERWSQSELRVLSSMLLRQAGPRPTDPSNRYEANPSAAKLGKALFNDVRFSRNGQVACASCHAPGGQFEDGKPQGQGLATGKRRTMPVMGASRTPFLFWDGRKDSLWSQALGPMEDGAEHGGNRVQFVRLIQQHYAVPYQAVFGPLPAMAALPANASPLGTDAERAAWAALPAATREQVNRVFANMGKAIAAYESQVQYGPAPFDRYVEATLAGKEAGQTALSPQQVRGLRLFINKGQCITCHNGPLLTDNAFHNTGVPPLNPASPDPGRAAAIRKLVADEFNCLGRYSDARPEQCGELNFLATDDPAHLGAFRTPSLRNVAARPPYMHAGQFATLPAVVQHYIQSPPASVGRSELARPGEPAGQRQVIRLTQQEVEDLVAFLGGLTGPVSQP